MGITHWLEMTQALLCHCLCRISLIGFLVPSGLQHSQICVCVCGGGGGGVI